MLSGGLVIALTQGCIVLIGFLAQRAILSTLEKDANGLLNVERRIAELILVILVDVGLNGIAMRRLVQFPERANEILSSLLAFRLTMLIPATLVCLIWSGLSGYNTTDVALYCLFLGISSRSGLVRYALELPFRANVRFTLISATSIVDAVVFAGLVYLWKDELSPSIVIKAQFLSAIPGFIILLFLGETHRLRLRFVSVLEIRTLLIETMPVLVTVILVNIHDKVDSLMLERLTDEEQVGIFSAAYGSLGPIPSTIAMSLALAMAPGIARLAIDDFASCRRYAFTGLRFLLVIAVCISAFLSVLTPFIIELLSKGRYSDNHAHFFAFLWMPAPIFLLVFIQELNVALGKQSRNIPVAWTLFLGTVILGFALIPAYGAFGAIVAKLGTLAVASSFAIVSFTQILSQPLPLSLVLRLLLLVAIGVTASLLIPNVLPMTLAAFAALIAVLIATLVLGVVDKSDVMKVKSLLFASRG